MPGSEKVFLTLKSSENQGQVLCEEQQGLKLQSLVFFRAGLCDTASLARVSDPEEEDVPKIFLLVTSMIATGLIAVLRLLITVVNK